MNKNIRVSLFTGLAYWTGLLDLNTGMTSKLELCSCRESENRQSLYCMHGDGYSDSVMHWLLKISGS